MVGLWWVGGELKNPPRGLNNPPTVLIILLSHSIQINRIMVNSTSDAAAMLADGKSCYKIVSNVLSDSSRRARKVLLKANDNV